jgi:uncharacterized protein YqgV (UPF0045/DUF77 family)
MLSVELSYYPLTQDYKPPIRELIDSLQASGVDVRPGSMSTQLFGDYEQVMEVLSEAMKWSFETHGKAAFVAKFIEGDRR